MICTTIQNKTLEEIYDIMENNLWLEMAEIRLDNCKLDSEDIEELFSQADIPLVATCRISETMPAREAEARLMQAIKAGVSYVDLEIEAPPMMSKRIRREAYDNGCIMIRSYHDYEGTDSVTALKAIVEKCTHLGADIVKIVTTAASPADVNKVMSLYDEFPPEGLIAFCMGDYGRNSRLECLGKGAPYTYAALSQNDIAAPGQWPSVFMSDALYGSFPMITGGELEIPSSKSFAQRAIIAAAMAEGTSVLKGYTPCEDSQSAIEAVEAMGAKVDIGVSKEDEGSLIIKGIGAHAGSFTADSLHTGESGLLTRMMIPLLAAVSSGRVHVTGEKTLLGRPLKGAGDIMKPFGVTLVPDTSYDDGEIHMPLTVKGLLKPVKATLSGQYGSQLISGLLAALPLADGDSTINLVKPKSIPYIFITMDVLKKFGIEIDCTMEGGEEFEETRDWNLCEEMVLHIRGGQRYKAAEITLEGDWSVAANFAVAGSIFGDVTLLGLDTKSLQADLSILDILNEAGAYVTEEEEDNGSMISFRKAPLVSFAIDVGNCPDLFPILAVLAAFSQGTSRITGISRLASKESNRCQAVLDMLTQMGVNARIKGDSMTIDGHSFSQRLMTGNLLKGGKYTSCHDHRMVMALSVASLGADSPITIDDVDCVAKSCPGFFDLFEDFLNLGSL